MISQPAEYRVGDMIVTVPEGWKLKKSAKIFYLTHEYDEGLLGELDACGRMYIDNRWTQNTLDDLIDAVKEDILTTHISVPEHDIFGQPTTVSGVDAYRLAYIDYFDYPTGLMASIWVKVLIAKDNQAYVIAYKYYLNGDLSTFNKFLEDIRWVS